MSWKCQENMFTEHLFDLDELRNVSWRGIPKQYRAQAWKLLCVKRNRIEYRVRIEFSLFQGYLPAKIERREETLTRKRDEYWSYVDQYYPTRTESEHLETFRQVSNDFFSCLKMKFDRKFSSLDSTRYSANGSRFSDL